MSLGAIIAIIVLGIIGIITLVVGGLTLIGISMKTEKEYYKPARDSEKRLEEFYNEQRQSNKNKKHVNVHVTQIATKSSKNKEDEKTL